MITEENDRSTNAAERKPVFDVLVEHFGRGDDLSDEGYHAAAHDIVNLFRSAPVSPSGGGERDWLADVREVLADAYTPEGIEVWLDADSGGRSRRQMIEDGSGEAVLTVAQMRVGRTLDEIRAGRGE